MVVGIKKAVLPTSEAAGTQVTSAGSSFRAVAIWGTATNNMLLSTGIRKDPREVTNSTIHLEDREAPESLMPRIAAPR